MVKLTPEQRRFFAEPNLCAVSTNGADGYPHVTMVWVDIDDDDHVILNSTERRSWPKNLRRDPRVGLCVFDREQVFHNVAAMGRVIEMTNEGAWDVINQLARKYGLEKYEGDADRVTIKIEVESIFNYGF
jgi:PPOX class probable F420-dependent enzyme